MHFKSLRGASALCLLTALTSCGGGTGGSGDSQATIPATPTPTPTSTPAPATTFSMVAAGPLAGSVVIDNNNDGDVNDPEDAVSWTSPAGEFGRDVAVPRLTGSLPGALPTAPTATFRAGGLDVVTGVKYNLLFAPAGATVISPLSSLAAAAGSESAVRNGLGIDGGSDPLRSSLSILTFNPYTGLQSGNADIRHDAARLTALNIQLVDMAILARRFRGDPVDYDVSLAESSDILAKLMRDTGPLDFTRISTLMAILNESPFKTESQSQRDMIAQMLSNYFAVMPSTISDDATARAWVLTFRFVIVPFIGSPEFHSFSPNPPFSVITQQEVLQWVQYFMTAPKPDVGTFSALTDYRELRSMTVPSYKWTLSDCGHGTDLPTCNDFGLYGENLWLNALPLAEIMSVQSSDPQSLGVTLSPQGAITMTRVGNFVGMTYFTYMARLPGGMPSAGRVYVRVWP